MARGSLPEFAGKMEEDPERFLLQAEATMEETGIHIARWVTVLAPQLKAQAGTWRGTMRALNLPWEEFKSEFIEEFNGDELQTSLKWELFSTAQTKAETLGGYVLHKYQLYRRLNLGMTEEAVVKTVVGLMRDKFKIHERIEQLKSFSELRALALILDDSKSAVSDKAGVSTSGPPKLKWLDRKKIELTSKSQVPNPRERHSSETGCRVCRSHDHWQAECLKRKSESGNAKTTGGTAGSRPAKK